MDEGACIVCYERDGELHNPCSRCSDLRLHDRCLQKWLTRSNSCPTCRMPLLDEDEEEESKGSEEGAATVVAPAAEPIPVATPFVVLHRHVLRGMHGFDSSSEDDLTITAPNVDVLIEAVRSSRRIREARQRADRRAVLQRAIVAARAGGGMAWRRRRRFGGVAGGGVHRGMAAGGRQRGRDIAAHILGTAALVCLAVFAAASAGNLASTLLRMFTASRHGGQGGIRVGED